MIRALGSLKDQGATKILTEIATKQDEAWKASSPRFALAKVQWASGDRPEALRLVKKLQRTVFVSVIAGIIRFWIIGYFLLFNPERKRRAETQRMLDELKKNDRIVTIGGIYGTVVTAAKDSEEVTIRVDENSNTKLRVLRSAISRVITDESTADKKETAKKDT